MAKTAAEAKNFIESMNARQRALRPSMLRNIGKLYVFNLYWHPFEVSLGHLGSFKIPAFNKADPRQARRGYSEPLVLPEIFAEEYDLQSGKMGVQLWDMLPSQSDDPEEREKQPGVIRDVLGIGSSNPGLHAYTTDRSWFGVFVATGQGATKEERARAEKEGEWNFPTAHELDQARGRLTQMMQRLYEDAEQKALQGPNGLKDIQPTEREACDYLGLNASWARKTVPQGTCPECGAPIQPGLPVHFIQQGGCGAVLDEEKVRKNRTPGYEHIWAKPVATATK